MTDFQVLVVDKDTGKVTDSMDIDMDMCNWYLGQRGLPEEETPVKAVKIALELMLDD